ncbi:MAG: hypothetical protein BWK73_09320 [Thiothrix lacustris]|uniref:ASCH domain-containing protein n=1 Tax=Thiothrix lacustris TaxID=525917 RepID=A0A1Y1QV65_9GAMM|nr:MAG: hypothetical protein BWK73_09320 [Thiothrix lacustris]
MRNMSFAMTTAQVQARTKSVTRRFGWWFLEPDTEIRAVKKAMGLKKGERVEELAVIRVVSTRKEPLNAITQDDVIKEGFPDWTPEQFIAMLVEHYKVDPRKLVNRIEFEYVEGATKPAYVLDQLEFPF